MADINIVQWNNAPDYDAWGFDDSWSCSQWMLWYDALQEHFGKDTARQIWQYALLIMAVTYFFLTQLYK